MYRFRMVLSLVAATVTALVLTAIPAMAQYPPPRPADTDLVRGPEAVETSVAFTGSDVTILMVAIALLVVTGIVAIRLGRQRAPKATA